MDAEQNHGQRIAELESNLERAALFGKQLLDQLSLKSRYVHPGPSWTPVHGSVGRNDLELKAES